MLVSVLDAVQQKRRMILSQCRALYDSDYVSTRHSVGAIVPKMFSASTMPCLLSGSTIRTTSVRDAGTLVPPLIPVATSVAWVRSLWFYVHVLWGRKPSDPFSPVRHIYAGRCLTWR